VRSGDDGGIERGGTIGDAQSTAPSPRRGGHTARASAGRCSDKGQRSGQVQRASLKLRADGAYQVFQQDRPKRDLTVRIIDKLPAEDDLLAELQKFGCEYQFNAWLRDKVMAAKGKS
jgi:hypothetical protein